MKKLKYGIALTGGIATGKSTATSFLKTRGYSVIDADLIAHQTLQDQKQAVLEYFGEQILHTDGTISRPKLGEIVFADPKKLEALENILHPHIKNTILTQCLIEEAKQVPFFADIPIFFEKPHLFDFFEHSLLIYIPQAMQYTRLQARNNLSLEQARQRINAQIDIEQKRSLASYIIHNTGSIESLQADIEKYLEILKNQYDL